MSTVKRLDCALSAGCAPPLPRTGPRVGFLFHCYSDPDISRVAGVRLLMVHAIDDDAATFYQRYGFNAFPAGGRTMFLPIETIAAALDSPA